MFEKAIKRMSRYLDAGSFSESGSRRGQLVPYEFPTGRQPSVYHDRHLVALGIDKSPSTFVNAAHLEIREGVSRFKEQVGNNALLRNELELAIFAFGRSQPVECFCDFTPVHSFVLPEIPESFSTYVYELYIEMIKATLAREEHASATLDQDSRASWCFLISDFQDQCRENYDEAMRLKEVASRHSINMFMIGAGNAVDVSVAQELAQVNRPPIHLQGIEDFTEFFKWLSGSLSRKSRSSAGQTVQLEPFRGQRLIAEG